MRQRQENLICKHFQRDNLSEERKDLGRSYGHTLEYSRAPSLQYVGPPVDSSASCSTFEREFRVCFLAANTKFCFQSKFTFLCFLLFNFFLDCVIHKQSFGGKIIGFQSLKWPHNGCTVWGSKGKRSNSTPFCFGCPDTFVTGV